ncbi:hypothetical protein KY362_01350 [Candidatus Woesearchaeota archaeon]|nr:hypothetical protein [Candidatus Woesearchaeota archaeon]
MSQCSQQYSYNMCTYWTGQVFAAIPIFQYIEQIGNLLSNIVENPVSFAIGIALDKTCQLLLCSKIARTVGCAVCYITNFAAQLAAIAADLFTNTQLRWQAIGFDLCEEALKENPSRANIEWPGRELSEEYDEDEDDDD